MSSSPESAGRLAGRHSYIDWARGIAVLIMLQVHALDAWTEPAARSGEAFRYLRLLGGFAAPLFLWLAGVSLALAAEARIRRTGDRGEAWRAAVRRGLEIFVLAFLFRLQSFLLGLGAQPLTVFRVDILNVMGLALAAAGLLLATPGTRAARLGGFAAVTLAIAMATPLVWTAQWVSALPVWVQWHLRPAGEHTTFTGLPWAGFVFAGAVVGTALAGLSGPGARHAGRVHIAVAAAGAAVLSLGLFAATLPTIYPESSFWTSSPAFFAVRVGILTLGLSVLFLVVEPAGAWLSLGRWIPMLGRSSLFVYWIHVELTYGWAGYPLRRSLSLPQALMAWMALVWLMCVLIPIRDRLVALWGARFASAPVPGPRCHAVAHDSL